MKSKIVITRHTNHIVLSHLKCEKKIEFAVDNFPGTFAIIKFLHIIGKLEMTNQ